MDLCDVCRAEKWPRVFKIALGITRQIDMARAIGSGKLIIDTGGNRAEAPGSLTLAQHEHRHWLIVGDRRRSARES